MKPKLKVLAAAVVAAGTVAGVAAAASSPSVVTGATSAVHSTSAVLHGTVNPNGRSTTYFFQWGLTERLRRGDDDALRRRRHQERGGPQDRDGPDPGHALPLPAGCQQRIGPVGRHRPHVQDRRSSAPAVATGPASGVSSTSATVTGVVNPNGATTTYEFQFGLTTAYGMQTDRSDPDGGQRSRPGVPDADRLDPGNGVPLPDRGSARHDRGEPGHRPGVHDAPVDAAEGRDHRAHEAGHRPVAPVLVHDVGQRQPPQHSGHVRLQRHDHRQVLQSAASRVGTFLIPLGGNCTFSGKNTFRKLPRAGRVNGQVHLTIADPLRRKRLPGARERQVRARSRSGSRGPVAQAVDEPQARPRPRRSRTPCCPRARPPGRARGRRSRSGPSPRRTRAWAMRSTGRRPAAGRPRSAGKRRSSAERST